MGATPLLGLCLFPATFCMCVSHLQSFAISTLRDTCTDPLLEAPRPPFPLKIYRVLSSLHTITAQFLTLANSLHVSATVISCVDLHLKSLTSTRQGGEAGFAPHEFSHPCCSALPGGTGRAQRWTKGAVARHRAGACALVVHARSSTHLCQRHSLLLCARVPRPSGGITQPVGRSCSLRYTAYVYKYIETQVVCFPL